MDAKPINVLLIEDNPDDAVLIDRYLSKALKDRFALTHVDRLGKGLERLKVGGVDVVLLDLGLPDANAAVGLDSFNQTHACSPGVPIIVLTSHDADTYAVEAVRKGAQDFLVKGQVTVDLLGRSLLYAIERQKLQAQLEQAAKEIKTLKGFLPICASCKKIRDDKGYWTQIEAYISERTEAEFSHGLCPECGTRLYGRFAEKVKKAKEEI